MNLYEYESKKILLKYNLPVLNSYLTNKFLFIKNYIYKIQVDSNYRKKGGGIIIPHTKNELIIFYNKWIFKKFNKKLIKNFLLEKIIKIEIELFLSLYIQNDNLIIVISNKGGINVEFENKNYFLKIKIKTFILFYSIYDYLLNCKVFKKTILNIIILIFKLYKVIIKNNILLMEINPLVIYKKNIFILDCKIIKEGIKTRNFSDFISNILKLNYIKLKGNICCIVNGAGLALKILDIFSFNNLKCSNFIDLSGSITEIFINNLLKMILIDKNLSFLIINIFGGIVSCEKILIGFLNIFYYNFNFKIIIKLNGLNSKFVLKKLINLKNVIIINNYKYLFYKCKILK
ncbi:ATP-grasp domain-containing protein [Candidatus Carsonella ruddii]|uniref:Succinyl-CoA synthetase beta subunit n=1 Tax=Candidatus Carsonella ruddii PC isolate NHV TaxID=1202540 RepID=J3YQR7_CARRU|nr:ATP-grasp domain-containing protein [Candidatus Carsonella ruddii]AFP84328.1 succinyl-CoA synthetase beta subunit [Candidatus Carsonella ruddii PC isolate NHV]